MKKLLLAFTVLFIGIVLSACGNDEKDVQGIWIYYDDDESITLALKDNKISNSYSYISDPTAPRSIMSLDGEYEKGSKKGEFNFKIKERRSSVVEGKTFFTPEDELLEMEDTFNLIDEEHLEFNGKIFTKDKEKSKDINN